MNNHIAVITDQHFGARSDNNNFHKYFAKFYSECFFPTIDERGITRVIMCGDTMDRRKYVQYNSLKSSKEYYFDPLAQREIDTDVVVGNHDIALKNTNEINCADLLLGEYSNINVISNPCTKLIEGIPVTFLPWICADNYHETMRVIDESNAEDCFGHLEISGFPMYRGTDSVGGHPRETFAKFKRVFSGHFHHKSDDGHIFYLGAPYEMTWQDYNDFRGFHIFNIETKEMEYIVNPFSIFNRLEYDDRNGKVDVNPSDVREKYVKIIVTNKTDHQAFETYVNRIYNSNPYDVRIVEDFSEFQDVNVIGEINLEDTQEILGKYVDSVSTELDKEKIKTYMKQLYVEALSSEMNTI